MQPLSSELCVKASQTVTPCVDESPQYVASWCQEMHPGSFAFLTKNCELQQRTSGPITSSTASRSLGSRTSSSSQGTSRCGFLLVLADRRPPSLDSKASNRVQSPSISSVE